MGTARFKSQFTPRAVARGGEPSPRPAKGTSAAEGPRLLPCLGAAGDEAGVTGASVGARPATRRLLAGVQTAQPCAGFRDQVNQPRHGKVKFHTGILSLKREFA